MVCGIGWGGTGDAPAPSIYLREGPQTELLVPGTLQNLGHRVRGYGTGLAVHIPPSARHLPGLQTGEGKETVFLCVPCCLDSGCNSAVIPMPSDTLVRDWEGGWQFGFSCCRFAAGLAERLKR